MWEDRCFSIVKRWISSYLTVLWHQTTDFPIKVVILVYNTLLLFFRDPLYLSKTQVVLVDSSDILPAQYPRSSKASTTKVMVTLLWSIPWNSIMPLWNTLVLTVAPLVTSYMVNSVYICSSYTIPNDHSFLPSCCLPSHLILPSPLGDYQGVGAVECLQCLWDCWFLQETPAERLEGYGRGSSSRHGQLQTLLRSASLVTD